jgi:uncharacterized protein YPO0396
VKQELLWRDSETFILSSIELYNWGGFQGYHHAEIDPSGTAVIGPTGSGKTTLVDVDDLAVRQSALQLGIHGRT